MTPELALRIGQKTDFLMTMQERTGVCFDIEKAKELYDYCCKEMTRIENEIEPQLPDCDLTQGDLKAVTPPVRQMKAGKEGPVPSSYSENFFDEIEEVEGSYYGTKEGIKVKLPCPVQPLYTKGPMKLKNQAQLKDWLISLGWRPTLWNFKKDNNNKFIRDERNQLIKTSPKFHEQGTLCENLELLGDKVEIIKPIVTWLSLRNRRSVLCNPEKETGWLNNDRLKIDGRLSAGRSGVTNTLRQKHVTVANIPRVSSLLGKEMRSLFRAEEGKVFVGYDASGLEARVEGHWTYKYDGGQYASELVEGDIHSTNARVFFGEGLPTNEEGKVVDEYRNPSKSGKYCLSYGGSAPKLADTLNIPQGKAKQVYDDFWEANWALAKFRDNLVKHWEAQSKKGVLVPLTGTFLHSRSQHSLVNLVFQHTGAMIMDISALFMDKWLGGIVYDSNHIPHYKYKGEVVKRVIYYHDELIWECNESIAEEILHLGKQSIIKTGEYLKLNVPLDADGNIGLTWGDVH